MKNLALLLITTVVIACSPNTYYLGDIYSPTDHVDVYYDEGDIKKEYKVIGQLSGDNLNTVSNLEDVKQELIKEAAERGADGILFLFSDSIANDHLVKSKLLKYEK